MIAAELVVDPTVYDVVLAGEPASDALATFRTPDGITSIVATGAAVGGEASREPGWRHITIEADLPFDVVGFFRRYADALAEAGIPILPFASFRFDHVLVPADRLADALAAMEPVSRP